MKRQLVAMGVAATMGVAGVGAGIAHAATNANSQGNPMTELVDAVSTKFNLNEDEVQKVFDEQHAKHEQQENTQADTQLAQLVTDKKLTQAQADAIKAKRTELQTQREADRASFESLSETERHAKMEEKRTALDAWAKENNIDTQYLRFVMGGGHDDHGPGRGGPGGDMRQ